MYLNRQVIGKVVQLTDKTFLIIQNMTLKTSEDLDFEKMFRISLTALRINGSHPSVPRDKKWLIKFFVMHGMFTVVFCIITYNIYLSIILKNYSNACKNSTVGIMYCVISFQYYVLVTKTSTITRIMDMMKADFAKDMPEDARAIVLSYAQTGRKLTVQWLVVVGMSIFVFMTKHIFLELYTYVIDDWKLLQAFPLTYPSPVEEYKYQPVVYALLYVLFLYYLAYASDMYLGFVPLGLMFMLHACGQLEIVKIRASALYAKNLTTRELEAKVIEVVKSLQYIYGFVESINQAFSLMYEITLKATTLILPVTLYEVIESLKRGEFTIEYVTIIIGAGLISGSPCYYSDKLMEMGEKVRFAIYSCGWESRYDHGIRKTLLVMLIRTLRPIAIRTVFRTVCLDAFTDLVRQSYALFNLMNAAWG